MQSICPRGQSPRALNEAVEDIRLRFGADRIVELSAAPRICRFTGDTVVSKNPIAGDQRGSGKWTWGPPRTNSKM